MRTFLLIATLLVLVAPVDSARFPFLKKKHTPLLFFTLPKELSEENDALEKCVSAVERELGVRVERLDVLRDPPSQALLGTLTRQPPPFLYNTDSCQVIHGATPKAAAEGSDDKKRKHAPIEKSRVIAWAKGRYLPPRRETTSDSTAAESNSPVMLSRSENAIDQEELLDELNLTPVQRKGKRAIRDRTEGKSDSES